MDPLAQLAEHLTFLTEMGIDGVSRDPSWRQRGESAKHVAEAAARSAAITKQADVAEATSSLAEASARRRDLRATPEIELRATRETAPGDTREQQRAAHPESEATAGKSGLSGLTSIRADLGDCTRCKLHALGRRQIVFGVGNPEANLMFVGEAPGRDEDIQGIPFVGRAGQLLTKMIEAMGYKREDVYIANVIKCRPPENRNPDPDEVAACEPFLFRQVEAIRPRVIVALGTFAAQALLRTQDSISRLRGRVYLYGGAKLIPTFHPAYLLRSPDKKRDAWEDLKRARAILEDEE